MMRQIIFVLLGALACGAVSAADLPGTNYLTHGPLLGKVTSTSIRVWARTFRPGQFTVRYGSSAEHLHMESRPATTVVDHDHTGWVALEGLTPSTRYHYQVTIAGIPSGPAGSFQTLPDAAAFINPAHNPAGKFNVRFQFGSCANQNPKGGIGPSTPTWDTMHRMLPEDVLFSVMNGDFIYEEHRSMRAEEWLSQVGIDAKHMPTVVAVAPSIVGVWENYKTYLSRSAPLSTFYRHRPISSTFDDHELVNDIRGCGTTGFRERRAVFRDIGIRAWEDYLGWANPFETSQPIQFGVATLKAGSDVLVDEAADFSKLDLKQAANLHVHWGTINAGEDDIKLDSQPGNPNAGVFAVREIVDRHRLRISPAAYADGTASYSVGRRSYGKTTVSNCDLYYLDCKTHREMHDVGNPAKKGLSMLGAEQKDWLLRSIRSTPSEFIFIVSSVNFMIHHTGAGGHEMTPGKDEAWTALIDEREELIDAFAALGKPVFVLTADLHNSYSIKITDNVWEFASGPINSVNHVPKFDEGDRPMTGPWRTGPRSCDIRWSSYILPDVERAQRLYPYYCVVQVNNVFNMPQQLGDTRWVAYPHPQVIFSFHEGRTGRFVYSETITAPRK
jgi:alkaline phosphatase D